MVGRKGKRDRRRGSEAAAILGMNPYMSNVELWEYKTGRRQRENKDSAYMEYGCEAEKPLIELFGLDYPRYKTIMPEAYRLQRNEEYPYILGTVDAELLEEETKRIGFLEVKTTNILASGQKEQWNERIPQNYYVQCLHYLLVNPEYEYFYLKAQLKNVWKGQGDKDNEVRLTTKHYYFERKEVEEDLKVLKEKEIEFWQEYVKKDKRPNLVLPPI
ncbi:MAG: YqaJ viral recombinase family protein [Endomicrobium sp.]|jgi:predicted phage-related endonuclease|nr:YqaJ viral recombinase family protein [Endomicrobium sp.]